MLTCLAHVVSLFQKRDFCGFGDKSNICINLRTFYLDPGMTFVEAGLDQCRRPLALIQSQPLAMVRLSLWTCVYVCACALGQTVPPSL